MFAKRNLHVLQIKNGQLFYTKTIVVKRKSKDNETIKKLINPSLYILHLKKLCYQIRKSKEEYLKTQSSYAEKLRKIFTLHKHNASLKENV